MENHFFLGNCVRGDAPSNESCMLGPLSILVFLKCATHCLAWHLHGLLVNADRLKFHICRWCVISQRVCASVRWFACLLWDFIWTSLTALSTFYPIILLLQISSLLVDYKLLRVCVILDQPLFFPRAHFLSFYSSVWRNNFWKIEQLRIFKVK